MLKFAYLHVAAKRQGLFIWKSETEMSLISFSCLLRPMNSRVKPSV